VALVREYNPVPLIRVRIIRSSLHREVFHGEVIFRPLYFG
jgi:hypothetical protein